MKTYYRNTKQYPEEEQTRLLKNIQYTRTISGKITVMRTEDGGGLKCRINGATWFFAPGNMSQLLHKQFEKGMQANISVVQYQDMYTYTIVSFNIPKLDVEYIDKRTQAVVTAYHEENQRREQAKINKETRRQAHRNLLHERIEAGYRPLMLFEQVEAKTYLREIYWISKDVSFVDAEGYIYKQHNFTLPETTCIKRHDLLGGGGWYPVIGTNYTIYCCQPVKKHRACSCGKDTYEDDAANYSLMNGIQFASYDCVYCFFDRNDIIVEDAFLQNPQHITLNYTEEYQAELLRQKQERLDAFFASMNI